MRPRCSYLRCSLASAKGFTYHVHDRLAWVSCVVVDIMLLCTFGHLHTAAVRQPLIIFALAHTSCLQAVHVSLDPVEAGGEVKLNLAALQQHEEPSNSLPAVRTSITSVSPHRRSTAHSPVPSPVSSEIQPLSESHQVGACLHSIATQMCKTWHSVFCCNVRLHSDTG